MTIFEAVEVARRQLLGIPGIVGIGYTRDKIIVYVESTADEAKVPPTIAGYPTEVRVSGKVGLL